MNRKRVVCYGDSNTWGYCSLNGQRYEDDVRWTQRLAALLGEPYQVVEEGLCGRTTVFEDPLNEGLSGLMPLASILLSHSPLDLLVVMLGTNDCKERFSANAQNIADGLLRLVNKARTIAAWRDVPRILIVAPIVMDHRMEQVPCICDEMGRDSVAKSEQLPEKMLEVAQKTGCAFMDSNPHVKPGPVDYMHFDIESNERFARALAAEVRRLLG